MRLRLIARRYLVHILALLAMAGAAVAVGAYILDHQLQRWPWQDVLSIEAEFAEAQAVTAGQGQQVTVAGVTVGEIGGVHLDDGRAVVELEIDPSRLSAVHADARVTLRPKTPLMDMVVELDPGTPRAPRLSDGARLPVSRAENPVSVHEVLDSLDADTQHYLRLLIGDGGRGVRGRSDELRALLRAGAPTLAHTRRVTDALVDRRRLLARLVSHLDTLGGAAASRAGDLAELVDAGSVTLGALAEQDRALRASLERLPGTIDAARGTLRAAGPLSRAGRPALRSLTAAARTLHPALDDLDPLLADAAPALRRLRELGRAGSPVLVQLDQALGHLRAVTPDLTSAFGVLVRVVNELAYNPPGDEEGYLFWLAWFAHNADWIVSIQDAHGAVWRGGVMASCSTLGEIQATAPLLQLVYPLPVCPEGLEDRGPVR